MGVRILEDKQRGECVMYCSTSEWAFGPLMPDTDTAEAFIKWCPRDPREYKDSELEWLWYEFRLAQQKKEEAVT